MKLRGAISGFGEVAANAHLVGWRGCGRVSIGAVHDPIADRRHQAIRLIRNARVYDDLELMLDGERPDFVDIASPPALHADAARMALEAGAHVLVEKPLCLSLDEFDELSGLARERGRILMCVHNWKYAPAYALAHSLIAEGRIGAVSSILMDRLRTRPAGADGAGGRWRLSAASGGGILIDHGWHVLYLMQWLMGEPPMAVSGRIVCDERGVDEVAEMELRFGSGRTARANLSWRAAARRTSAVITGERGALEIENDRIILIDGCGNRSAMPVSDIPDDSYHSSWFSGIASLFVEAVTRGSDSEPAITNLDEARNALISIISARHSAKNDGVAVTISA